MATAPENKPMDLLRFATAGSVDDGKSTLIGRLLLDSKSIFEDQLEAVEMTSQSKGYDYTDLALLTDGRRWVAVDPLAGFTDVAVLDLPAEFDLPGWYRAQGLTVDAAPLRRPADPAPWGPFTCVEAVKRLIGLRARRVLTPWQLHRHLTGGNHECPHPQP